MPQQAQAPAEIVEITRLGHAGDGVTRDGMFVPGTVPGDVVRVTREGGVVVVDIADDGRGGATAAAGTGLYGLSDRIDALEGRFEVDSPPGAGTRVSARLPLATRS